MLMSYLVIQGSDLRPRLFLSRNSPKLIRISTSWIRSCTPRLDRISNRCCYVIDNDRLASYQTWKVFGWVGVIWIVFREMTRLCHMQLFMGCKKPLAHRNYTSFGLSCYASMSLHEMRSSFAKLLATWQRHREFNYTVTRFQHVHSSYTKLYSD